MTEKEYTFQDVLLLVVIGAFAIMAMPFVASSAAYIQLDTAVGIEDTRTIQFNGSWEDLGTLSNLVVTQQGALSAENNQAGNYTSEIFDVPRNRVLETVYDTNLAGGNGTLTVRTWKDSPEGTPDMSQTVELEEGTATKTFNYTEQNYFQIEIRLEDTGAGLTEIEEFETRYEIVEGYETGIPTDTLAVVLMLVMFFGVSFLIFGLSQNPLN